MKNKGYKSIAVEKIPNKGLGKTINDRAKSGFKVLETSINISLLVRLLGVEPRTS